MRTYFYGAASGWLGAILIGGVALLPYVLRRSPLTKRLRMGFPSKAPYLRRMWPHYWLAYAATALSFEYAWIVMGRRGIVLRTSSARLFLATLAMVMLFVSNRARSCFTAAQLAGTQVHEELAFLDNGVHRCTRGSARLVKPMTPASRTEVRSPIINKRRAKKFFRSW